MESPWIRIEYETVNDADLPDIDKKMIFERHGDSPLWFHIFFSWKPNETIVFGKESVDRIVKKYPECHIYYRHRVNEKQELTGETIKAPPGEYEFDNLLRFPDK